MNILSQKIKENREKFNKEFTVVPMHHETDRGRILSELVFPEDIESHIHSSTIDILDTIDRWCKVNKTLGKSKFGEGANSVLTLIQNFIKETKKEIK